MSNRRRVIVVGLGPIGRACVHAIQADHDLALAGMVDTAEKFAGRTLDELNLKLDPSRVGEDAAIRVAPRLEDAPEADVALVTTTSDFSAMKPTIESALSRSLHVVSSCEELVWPWYRHAAAAEAVDAAAKARSRVVLGSGVNPGMVMDSLPVTLSGLVRRVGSMRCVRRVDVGCRRKPLQAKLGLTLSADQFAKRASSGGLGHRGFCESLCLLASGLGRNVPPGTVDQTIEPVLAEKPIDCALGLIEPGDVRGLHQTASWREPGADGLKLSLDLWMAAGMEKPADEITLEGPVSLKFRIPGGTPGDSATVAILLNVLRQVDRVSPGLRTMLDVPPAGSRGLDLRS